MLPRQGSEKAFWCREEGFTETGSSGPESREANAPDEEDGSLTPSVTRRTHSASSTPFALRARAHLCS